MEPIVNNVSHALTLYVGWKINRYPQENKERVINYYGIDKSASVLNEIEEVIRILESIQPDWSKHDLNQASKYAVRKVVEQHQYLSEEAKAALAWVYSWWWK